MFDWLPLTPAFLTGLTLFSAITFIGTLVLVPWMITQIPDDYFRGEHRGRSLLAVQHPLLRLCWLLLKNSIGYLFILLGLVLLFLPGQGLLTMLVGIVLVDFPMKFRLERWFVERRHVLKTLNWLRIRAGKNPLVLHPY
jgi:hypothetical protein